MELLLALYRLPRLPPTFGSTNASHALLVAFRAFAQQPGVLPPLFPLLRGALLERLGGAIAAADAVGGACVPLLPAEQVRVF